jgi:dTDP-4-amino-4,6-dideoxygalactose transaminase
VQGSILCVRDAAVLARMRELQSAWSVTPRSDFARRLARTAVLSVLGRPALFTRFARVLESRGRDLDEVLHAFTRGFPGPDFLERLRHAPGGPLLWLLDERLAHPERSLWSARRAWGRELLAAGAEVEVFGRRAQDHQFWVFAVGTDEPAQLVRTLRAAGFDATSRSSLVPVEPTGGGEPARGARELLARLVYVPLALDSTAAERAALAELLRGSARRFVLEPRAPLRQPGGYTSGPSGPSGQPQAIHTRSRAIHTTPKATE